MEQETLIYVEDNDKEEAKILTKGLMNEDIRNRAFINALGAELGLKYLALENINNSKTYNLHNVHKIIEEFDISDIMLSNIHIDVRVVFDENQIFIPKSHFEYDILPDIYLVFLLAQDTSHVKFLGFFEPKLINKNNHNSDYYFIEKEKLSSPLDLKSYVESFKGNRTESFSDDVYETAQTLMLSVVDQNASKEEMKELFKYLTKSSYLRDKFIEFENFEILSYKAERSTEITSPETAAASQDDDIIDATIDDLKQPEENGVDDSSSIAETVIGAATVAGVAAVGAGLAETAVSETAEAVEAVAETVSDAVEIAENVFSEEMSAEEVSDTGASVDSDMQVSELNMEEPLELGGIEELSPLDNITLEEPTALEEEESEVHEEAASLQEENTLSLDEPASPLEQDVVSAGTPASVENASEIQDVSHDFEEGNADDFFNDLGLGDADNGEISFDNVEGSSGEISTADSFEDVSVDFNTMEQGDLPRPDDLPSDDEVEILDISDVDAVPNNYDENISETVEFNNIELSHEGPCMNEVNGEQTVPVLSMNDFKPLEPIQETESFKAESYDMDSLSITDNMLPMPKLEPVDESFAPVDIDNINMNAGMMPAAESPVQAEPETETDSISSELDAIPDFGMEEMDMQLSEDTAPLLSNESEADVSAPEPDDVQAEALENLSAEDIVDAPVNEIPTVEPLEEEVPVSDMESLQQPVEEQSEPETISEQQETSEQVPEISEKNISEDIISELPAEDEQQPAEEENADLTALFNEVTADEHFSDDFDNIDDISSMPSVANHKNGGGGKMIAIAAVAAVLIVGGIFGVSALKNKPGAAEPEPLAQAVPENMDAQEPIADNSNILANTPEVQTLPTPQKEPVNVKQDKPEAKAPAAAKTSNKGTPAAYMGVSKLSWEVPDYLSYSENIKKYLQTAGKSIKLSLSSDLLLVNEYAYSNQMKVDLKLSSDGTLKDSKIVKSSGSKQIDNIVLQTVKDTLNVIKPAAGEVPTAQFHLALIINF